MNRHRKISAKLVALAASLFCGHAFAADAAPDYVTRAVADPGRPPWEIRMDGMKKPAEVMMFAGIKPGGIVADFIPGTGYYTRILSKLVGPTGRVYPVVPGGGGGGRNLRVAQRLGKAPATIPDELAQACVRGCYEEGMAPYMIPVDHVLAIQNISEYRNVTVMWESSNEFSLPEQADAVFTAGGYHQLHPKDGKLDVKDVTRKILLSLKPGGIYVVLDSKSAEGAGLGAASQLKRTDQAAAKAEILALGFEFDGESQVLANAADNHAKPADELSVRHKTDQFLMRFKKPVSMVGDKRPPASTTHGFYGNTSIGSMGSLAGGPIAGQRERREFYHQDGTYQEFGYVGRGPAPMQSGLWYWDADGKNCMLHQYPIDERAVVVCHDYIEAHKVGDTWAMQDGRPHTMIEGNVPIPPLPESASGN